MALAVKGQDVIKSAGSLNGVRSSVVERFPDKKEVVGPIPSAPTTINLFGSPVVVRVVRSEFLVWVGDLE